MYLRNSIKVISRFLVMAFFILQLILICRNNKVYAYSHGDGTQSNPYLISTAEDLNNVRYNLNKYFRQIKDIDLSSYDSWEPIGNSSNQFTGSYDGGGYKIKNLKICAPTSNAVGLFGYVTSAGEIKDLGVENANVSGKDYVGALVGKYYGLNGIENCYSNGSVKGENFVGNLVGMNTTNLRNCYSYGQVSGSDCVGGLLGENYAGSVSNCYSTIDVSGINYVGGLIGQNDEGIVNSCYSTGIVTGTNYIGGLVGQNTNGSSMETANHPVTINKCYCTGTVIGNKYVGGLAGDNYNWSEGDVPKYELSISNCYSTGTVIGEECAGGLVGENYGGAVRTSYSIVNVTGSSSIGGAVGVSNNNAYIEDCYYNSDETGQSDSNKGTPLNTDSMKYQNSFHGFDFSGEVWKIYDGVSFPQLNWESGWRDTVPPNAVTFTPADDEDGVSLDTSLTINFDKSVYEGTGDITVTKSDGSIVDTIQVRSNKVNIIGSAVNISLHPQSLNYGTQYYIHIEKTCFKNNAGICYVGINDSTQWKFATVSDVPPIPQPPPPYTPPVTVNNTPIVGNYNYVTSYETALKGKVCGSDADNDVLTYTLGESCKHGNTIVEPDGTWTYIPKAGSFGQDYFTVEVNDGNGGTSLSKISITVKPKQTPESPPTPKPTHNNVPTTKNYRISTKFETAVSGRVQGKDKDKNKLEYRELKNAKHGIAVVIKNGIWTYMPNKNFAGKDIFTVIIKDGRGGSAVSHIYITVKSKKRQHHQLKL